MRRRSRGPRGAASRHGNGADGSARTWCFTLPRVGERITGMLDYVTEVNHAVAPAADGEFRPLDLRRFRVWPPVVLAPMAGVTNAAFRRLCRSFGAGLYVSEMITARGLVEGQRKT